MIKIKKKMIEILEIPIEEIEDEIAISDLNFNSFALVEFIEWVEDEYKLRIDLKEFNKFKKVKDLFLYLEKNLHK